ncbi:glycosyltransferase family 2 protein [Nocardioides xinjiangensis]|uniref:glycosyltransferase family 2 protein n=1 Tax=Nocardioides xinjiangensis TaxID=2817376 RepID=UPI001B305705|nr:MULTISPECIES: glycosyltransferase [unclassified Nocardioides]
MTGPATSAPATEVTVIVVSYNHRDYVAEALDSIAAQTFPPRRIVVVDDASTDDSTEVIDRWIEGHAHLDVHTMFHRSNTGLCTSLNEALADVDTPLYTYLSADDRMLPHRLQAQLDRWEQRDSPSCAVYSNALRIDEHGQPLAPDYGTLNDWERVTSFEGRLHTELLKHNWIPAASVLLDTRAVRRVGAYNDEWFYEDHDLWLRLAATGDDILCVDQPLVAVRELRTSLGSTHFGADKPLHLAARLGILLDQCGVSDAGDAYIRDTAPHLALMLWRTGERPDLVARALALPGVSSSPRWQVRALLLRLGFAQEPRLLRRATAGVRRRRELGG